VHSHSRKPSSTRASKKVINSKRQPHGLNNTTSTNAILLPHSNSDSKSTNDYTRNSYNLGGAGNKAIGLLNTSNVAAQQQN